MAIDEQAILGFFTIPGKVAIVTGAGSGLGEATSKLFAQAGAKVVVSDLVGDEAKRVADEIVAAGGEAIAVTCDVSQEDQVQAMTKLAVDTFGGLDILVNNAAYRPKADFFEMSVETWDHMHNVNTRGTFLCSREAVKVMRKQGKERGGSIVNVSTIGTAHPTIFNNVHYDSSKGGINQITKSMAAEFAADGIRINAIMPNGMMSAGVKKMHADPSYNFPFKGPITMPGRTPLGLCEPIDQATTILFLVSSAAHYMTGHIMAVDGGYLVG